jgi:aminomethyltransferase
MAVTLPWPGLDPTPFHPRMAERNVANAWTERGRFTLPRHFGDPVREALAARASVMLADLGGFGRLRVHGPGAARLLGAACETDFSFLKPGAARDVVWRTARGGVRGFGTVARFGEENFVLESADTDIAWFETAARKFGAELRDESAERGVLLLAGPLAASLLDCAGLAAAAKLETQQHGAYEWKGVALTASRRARHGGFELACAADDAVYVFDRLIDSGRPHGLTLAGQDAVDLLFMETGIPLAFADFVPARDPDAPLPLRVSLGLKDDARGAPVLAGIEWDGCALASFSALHAAGRRVGRTLRSAWSPALRRTIALAQLEPQFATPGTALTLLCLEGATGEEIPARVVALPFLPSP